MIEQAIRSFLLGKAPITALVGSKIHVGDFVPLLQSDMPAIGIIAEPAVSQGCLDGSLVSLQFPVFTIKAKGNTFSDSIAIGDLVLAAFLGIPLGTTISTTVGGAPVSVPVVQVDILSEPFNEEEEDYGHGFTIKPRSLKIRVGWRRPITTI